MEESKMSKDGLAQRLQTSRKQVDRLLDPDNTSITLELLERLARAVGRELKIELACPEDWSKKSVCLDARQGGGV